jgi:hypothetical protein
MNIEDIKVGTPVTYWSVIKDDGSKHDPTRTVITSDPYDIGDQTVCMIRGKVGAVSIRHLEPIPTGKEDYTINTQWLEYLKLSGTSEERLPADQKREMKRAFFAGAGQNLVQFRQHIGFLPEEEIINVWEAQQTEIMNFWLNETNRQQ